MTQQQKKKNEVFYVGIKDPIELRRSLLESSKEIVQLLQDFEKFKELRDQKALLKEQIKKEVAESDAMMRKLKTILPKIELRIKLDREHVEPKVDTDGEEIKTVKVKKGKKLVSVKVNKPKKEEKAVEKHSKSTINELDKLEAELKKIEAKLGTL